jgi:membrane-bound lytic murein transglycosylase
MSRRNTSKKPKPGDVKNNNKQEKKSALGDMLVMDEADMEKLKANLRIQKTEILNEKKLLNDFQQQKEKIEKFWLMEKERSEDLTMELRNSLRRKQDLEEKQAFELKVYKQKVKHLLHEQQSAMTGVRIEGQSALTLLQNEQRQIGHQTNLNVREIKKALKRQELEHLDLVKNIKQVRA